MGERVSDESGVIICGRKPESYDPTLKSEDDRCPHCGAVGELDMGYYPPKSAVTFDADSSGPEESE